jgi:hypothetical protein
MVTVLAGKVMPAQTYTGRPAMLDLGVTPVLARDIHLSGRLKDPRVSAGS